jgi:hypothetical protein
MDLSTAFIFIMLPGGASIGLTLRDYPFTPKSTPSHRYIMGRDPKLMPPPMKLCKEMVEAMGGTDSEYYNRFKSYCCEVCAHHRPTAPDLHQGKPPILKASHLVSRFLLPICVERACA